jgi:glyoxylase-like metal-dependent hydrolase (beta-lactamase superfamily II)
MHRRKHSYQGGACGWIDKGRAQLKVELDGIAISKVVESSDSFLPLRFAFPEIGATDLRELRSWYWSDNLSENPDDCRMQMFLHSYVLQLGGKTFLIDTCAGNHKPRQIPFFNDLDQPYLENLATAGFRPEDIDYVLCTHLHFDHVGWNTRLENGKWVPTFPNARYVFAREDYEYFTGAVDDHMPDYRTAFLDSVLPVVEHGQAELVETNHVVEHELSGGVWLEGIPGHSVGSVLIHAGQAGESRAIFSGDLFHHPLQILRPLTRFLPDQDPELGAKTRQRIFEKYADSGSLFLPAHFYAGHVRRHQNSFRYDLLHADQAPLAHDRHI